MNARTTAPAEVGDAQKKAEWPEDHMHGQLAANPRVAESNATDTVRKPRAETVAKRQGITGSGRFEQAVTYA